MSRGNKKDPEYVVLRFTYSPLSGIVKGVRAIHTFPARIDAREFAANKNKRAKSSTEYKVQRVTPGPTARKR